MNKMKILITLLFLMFCNCAYFLLPIYPFAKNNIKQYEEINLSKLKGRYIGVTNLFTSGPYKAYKINAEINDSIIITELRTIPAEVYCWRDTLYPRKIQMNALEYDH